MKILITGASGFIGQALSKRLIADGHEVHGTYEAIQHSKRVKGVHEHICNLTEARKIEKLVERVMPEIVIHLAAKTEVEKSFENYLQVSNVNYTGTVGLVEALRKFNPKLKLFVMASTMETYGHHKKEDGAFTEDTKQNPMAPYAVAKLACEKYLEYMEYAYNFPFVAFRQTNTYGRYDNDYFVVERIITQMLTSNTCYLGEPDPIRNFMFIDDLIELYVEAIKNPDKVRGQFLVTGPDNAIPIHKLADMVKDKLNWKGTVQWHSRPKRPGEIYYLNSNPAKAKKLLNWEPKVSLSEGLDRTIQMWKETYASQAKQIRP